MAWGIENRCFGVRKKIKSYGYKSNTKLVLRELLLRNWLLTFPERERVLWGLYMRQPERSNQHHSPEAATSSFMSNRAQRNKERWAAVGDGLKLGGELLAITVAAGVIVLGSPILGLALYYGGMTAGGGLVSAGIGFGVEIAGITGLSKVFNRKS